MIRIRRQLTGKDLAPALERFWDLSREKLAMLRETWNHEQGAPVFTEAGQYTTRGWTDWTQGFQYGSELLQFDATGDPVGLDAGREGTLRNMPPHLTHFGVHDHGFNTISTYGALLRLMNEALIPEQPWARRCYEQAVLVSGAVQANRWTALPTGGGFIYSFNGPHSLFADTMRSLRVLAQAYLLGGEWIGENDRHVSLLERLVSHAMTTTRYAVYYGEERDAYDVRGRVAHESIFNINDGAYRCPNSQQGYSPFSTWTRGLAWIMLGCAEQLEFIATLPLQVFDPFGGYAAVRVPFLNAALATCDFFIRYTPRDGIPYWDTGAPELHRLGDYLEQPADPFNAWEPVDSSAAAIACQALLRLGRHLEGAGRAEAGPHPAPCASTYTQAGLTVLARLLEEPYLSTAPDHQGLILHSIYHRPNNWDHTPPGSRIPRGEASMWGDYHMREAALLVQRALLGRPHYTFFSTKKGTTA